MPNPIHEKRYKLFREMLLKSRLEKGFLQSYVADRLGKNQSFISKYERGERRLDMPEFLDVAEALEINPVEFIANYKSLLAKLK